MRRNEYIIFLCFLLGITFLSQCAPKISYNYITDAQSLDEVASRFSVQKESKACSDPLSYAPYDHLLHPMRTVRINVHFMNNENKEYGFNEKDGPKYMHNLLNVANDKLSRNQKMNLPHGNDTDALSPQYRYKLWPIKGNNDGYLYHYDDEHCFFVNKGKNKNNYNKDVIKKYAIGTDSILNIFVIPHHPDSLATGKYKASRTGIALGTSLKIAGLCENREKPWKFSPLLNHEIGHIFGLRHSWYRNDGCDDTPVHANCWQPNDTEKCKDPVSNNMMDYNYSQMAITPCQLGKIHKTFASIDGELRGLVVPDWCNLDESQTIRVTGNDVWSGALDLSYNVVVESGATLEIKCRVSMPKNSSITVEPGGKLILNHCRIHNDCGDKWKGIKLKHTKNDSALVEYHGDVLLENVMQDSLPD